MPAAPLLAALRLHRLHAGATLRLLTGSLLLGWTVVVPSGLMMLAMALVVPGSDRRLLVAAAGTLGGLALLMVVLPRLRLAAVQQLLEAFAAAPRPRARGRVQIVADQGVVEDALCSSLPAALAEAAVVPLYLLALAFVHPAIGGLALAEGAAIAVVFRRSAKRAAQDDVDLHAARRHAREWATLADPVGPVPAFRAGARAAPAVGTARVAQQERAVARYAGAERLSSRTRLLRLAALALLAILLGGLMVTRGLSPVAGIVAWILAMRCSAAVEALLRTGPAFASLVAALEPGAATPDDSPALELAAGTRLIAKSLTIPSSIPPLRALSFEMIAGEVLLVSGPSGSGKIALGRALGGVGAALEGRVGVLRDNVLQPLSRLRAAYLGPQALRSGLPIRDVFGLRDGAEGAGVPDAARRLGLAPALGALPQGMATPWDVAAAQWDSGPLRLLELAAILQGDPQLLVIDEPQAFLDGDDVQRLGEALDRCRAQGVFVVLVSNQRSLLAIAQRWLVLRAGTVAYCGPPDPAALAA